ncbi:hypothetical protein [Flavobacterium urocaniciphilum]|uniref:Signal peptidase n=1 Tax=Flavobacterium urocaniciphilum TaxID=1299341 RepID=A0A1H9A835_9FLAO|nr:hypothetical protein [Flavobacterium urocaniciphilum]SEP72892.1 hypothetical protein SAMN05444005_10210 [Flavobacterium urocaniciphilum]
MKNKFAQIFFILTLVLSSVQAFAADPPPPPPEPPPGLPIDSGIVVLFFIALITGYFISQKRYNKKTPN